MAVPLTHSPAGIAAPEGEFGRTSVLLVRRPAAGIVGTAHQCLSSRPECDGGPAGHHQLSSGVAFDLQVALWLLVRQCASLGISAQVLHVRRLAVGKSIHAGIDGDERSQPRAGDADQ